MNKLKIIAMIMGVIGFSPLSQAADCASLQDQKNLIYAAHGYCFKDPAAQSQYGADCHTKRPTFSAAESDRLVQINDQMKALSCPKKD